MKGGDHMAKDKPLDIIDAVQEASSSGVDQTQDEQNLAIHVQSLFRAAWLAKQNMQLHAKWKMFDDYYHSRQVAYAADANSPNSNTNIIKPIIDSQIADLVDKTATTTAAGVELSDEVYSVQVQHMMDFILQRNRYKQKLELAEHDRLELGTSVYKVYFDEDALSGRGLPSYEIVNPANFFPDPKVTAYYNLNDAEFIIHATWKPLSWFRRTFPERGKYIIRQVNALYDPKIYEGDHSDETEYNASQRALYLECYMKDEKGELYCIGVSQYVVLMDTRKEEGKKLQRRNRFPFVVIPDYPQRGILWGQGDVELLIPTQDLVNDLDDQIRINARLMGNPQIVFGVGAGNNFDVRKWTSNAGLRVPMRDQNAFRVVEARPVSPDVPVRREKAFQEADLISGRPDVTRGQQPTGVTAFRAISALQQAGQRGVLHKKEMYKEGFKEVLELLYDEMIENWDAEIWVRIEGQTPEYKFYDPRKLKQVSQLIPTEFESESESRVVPLMDNEGQELTRDAEFDLNLTIGDGLPSDKSFIFEMLVDLCKTVIDGRPLVSWMEMREYLRENFSLPLKDETEEPQLPTPMPGQPPMPGMTPPMGGMPPMMPQAPPMPPNVVPMMGGVPNVG
jgi:hypothetical protein